MTTFCRMYKDAGTLMIFAAIKRYPLAVKYHICLHYGCIVRVKQKAYDIFNSQSCFILYLRIYCLIYTNNLPKL